MAVKVFYVDARLTNEGLKIDAQSDGGISTILLPDEINTPLELAKWLLDQTFKVSQTIPSLRRKLTVTYHTENLPNSDGDLETQTIVDSVVGDTLPFDVGRDGFAGLPGWADWTADEAEAWVEANVDSLMTAKFALVRMARAIVYLRNATID